MHVTIWTKRTKNWCAAVLSSKALRRSRTGAVTPCSKTAKGIALFYRREGLGSSFPKEEGRFPNRGSCDRRLRNRRSLGSFMHAVVELIEERLVVFRASICRMAQRLHSGDANFTRLRL